ncbi:MAG: hypothetical protein KDD60_05520, partial [Bdellovibrionales bacterium]|nr:hypothetical protein [Bdellovibrionales bacterium]
MEFSRIAWRGVQRHLIRSILTSGAIAFTTAVLIFFISLQLSSYDAAINATTGLFQGHIQIQKEAYFKKSQIHEYFEPSASLQAEILKFPGISVVAPRASS